MVTSSSTFTCHNIGRTNLGPTAEPPVRSGQPKLSGVEGTKRAFVLGICSLHVVPRYSEGWRLPFVQPCMR